MLIPLTSDAPLYHRPWGTIGIIAANVVLFFTVEPLHPLNRGAWTLEFGRFVPVQWISSSFSHGGILHLIGNMVFLSLFGRIVEGKLGWYRFVPLYLGMAAVEGLVTQVLMLGTDPVSVRGWGQVYPCALGASGVIFGLLAICYLWAPRNEVRCLLILIYRPFEFELRISTLCGFFIGWDVLMALLGGLSVGTSLLHVIGACVGVGTGILFLRQKWVDCEGWDWFSIRRAGGLPGRVRRERPPPARAPEPEPPARKPEPEEDPREARARINSLCEEGDYRTAAAAMGAYLDRHPGDIGVRLSLAGVLVRRLERPSAALRHLAALDDADPTPAQLERRSELASLAQSEIDRGVIELADD